jgi:hypothetical protein
MRTEVESRLSDHRGIDAIDAALDRLRQDLLDLDAPLGEQVDEPSGTEPIDFATLEFEVERMRKRLAIWDILLPYMRDDARSWPEVQRALTGEETDRIVAICDGVPLRDVLLDMG